MLDFVFLRDKEVLEDMNVVFSVIKSFYEILYFKVFSLLDFKEMFKRTLFN